MEATALTHAHTPRPYTQARNTQTTHSLETVRLRTAVLDDSSTHNARSRTQRHTDTDTSTDTQIDPYTQPDGKGTRTLRSSLTRGDENRYKNPGRDCVCLVGGAATGGAASASGGRLKPPPCGDGGRGSIDEQRDGRAMRSNKSKKQSQMFFAYIHCAWLNAFGAYPAATGFRAEFLLDSACRLPTPLRRPQRRLRRHLLPHPLSMMS